MRVLVCGDRHWSDRILIAHSLAAWVSKVGRFTLIHGDAPGADRIAGEWGQSYGLDVEAYPAHWSHTAVCPPDCRKTWGRRAGPIRNAEMLKTGIDVVLAFHDDLSQSKGTLDMIVKAKKAKVATFRIGHDTTSVPTVSSN